MSANIRAVPEPERTERISEWLKVSPSYGMSMMDVLYNRLDGMYPGRFSGSFKNEASIQNWREEWAGAFEAHGIKPHHIKPGLVECQRMFDWPPSVKEFLDACRAAIQPAAHRDFAPMLTAKEPVEQRRTNAAKFSAYLDKLYNRKPKERAQEDDGSPR